jgi:hypothetical protein
MEGFRIGQILWNNLGNGKWMRFGTWIVRNLYRASSLKAISSELE